MNSEGFKVKIYVLNDPKDSASGRTFFFPVIPRVGDFIDVKYKVDEVNHPNMSELAVFEVKRIVVNQVGSKFDATLHVEGDEELK